MAILPSQNHKPERPAQVEAPLAPAAAPAQVEARRTRSTVEGYRPPSRVGKRAAVAWLEPEAIKQLNIEAIRRGRTVQDILAEAVNDWFAREGLPRFDDTGVPSD